MRVLVIQIVTYVTRTAFSRQFMSSPARHLEDLRQTALHYSLSHAPIFSGLPEDDLRRIAQYAQIRRVRKGAYLFRQDDPVIGFFVVRLGQIHVSRANADGGESILHVLHPGESFAERAIIDLKGYPANARAVENTEVILIPSTDFKRHQKDRPDLAWRIVSSMSHHLRSLVSALEGLRIPDAEKRVIHWILQRCPAMTSKKVAEISLEMNQTELGAELAIRRETLSRILRKLREEGYLYQESRRLRVTNVGRLRERFEERS